MFTLNKENHARTEGYLNGMEKIMKELNGKELK
jgi:hypothetical protein